MIFFTQLCLAACFWLPVVANYGSEPKIVPKVLIITFVRVLSSLLPPVRRNAVTLRLCTMPTDAHSVDVLPAVP